MNYLLEYTEFEHSLNYEARETLLQMMMNETDALLGMYNLEDLSIMQEAGKSSLRERFDKIIEWIKKMWTKFVDRITSLFMRKLDWMKKHEDKIKQPVKIDLTYEMYPYFPEGFAQITKIKLPIFDLEKMRPHLASDEAFISEYFPDFKHAETPYDQMAEEIFKGGLKRDVITIDYKTKTMWQYYGYCKDAKKNIDNINKEKNDFTNALNRIARTVVDIGADKDKTQQQGAQNASTVEYVDSVLMENTVFVPNEKFGIQYADDIELKIINNFRVQFMQFLDQCAFNHDKHHEMVTISDFYKKIFTDAVIHKESSSTLKYDGFECEIYLLSFNVLYCVLNIILDVLVRKFDLGMEYYMIGDLWHSYKPTGNSIVDNLVEKLKHETQRRFIADNSTNIMLDRILTESKKIVDANYGKLSKDEEKVILKLKSQFNSAEPNETTLGKIEEIVTNTVNGFIAGSGLILGIGLTISFIGAMTILATCIGLIIKLLNANLRINVIVLNNTSNMILKMKKGCKDNKERNMVDELVTKLQSKKKMFHEEEDISIAYVQVLTEEDGKEKQSTAPKQVETQGGNNQQQSSGNNNQQQQSNDNKSDTKPEGKDVLNSRENLEKQVTGSGDAELVRRYQTICTKILMAKLNAFDEGNKTYLGIIEKHIRSYVGNDSKEGSSTKGEAKYMGAGVTKKTEKDGSKTTHKISSYVNGELVETIETDDENVASEIISNIQQKLNGKSKDKIKNEVEKKGFFRSVLNALTGKNKNNAKVVTHDRKGGDTPPAEEPKN